MYIYIVLKVNIAAICVYLKTYELCYVQFTITNCLSLNLELSKDDAGQLR